MPSSALRLALRALVAVQRPGGTLGAAVRHAVGARPTPAEAEVERPIEQLRVSLAGSPATVEVEDHGAGTQGGARPPVRRVADMYAAAASPPAWGRLLFGLVRALRPVRVLELGTHLGLSGAHIAAALALNAREDRLDDEPDEFAGGRPVGRLVTLEGAPAVAALARRHLAALGHAEPRVRVVVGPFAETLHDVAASDGPFDLVFVDGHHEEAAARAYVEALRPHLAPGGVMILDDVEPGRPVARAWRRLRAEHPAAPAVWLGKWGMIALGSPAAAPAATGGAQPSVGATFPVARPT